MPRKIAHTTQATLNKQVQSSSVVRVGYTNNPARRASEYARSGITGTMYVAPTTNGRYAENRLLGNQFAQGGSHRNVQSRSNISNGANGYVYTIHK